MRTWLGTLSFQLLANYWLRLKKGSGCFSILVGWLRRKLSWGASSAGTGYQVRVRLEPTDPNPPYGHPYMIWPISDFKKSESQRTRGQSRFFFKNFYLFIIISLFRYGLYKWKETRGPIFILSNYYKNQIKQQMRKRKCRR